MTKKLVATAKLPLNSNLAESLEMLGKTYYVEVVDIENGEFVIIKLYEKEEEEFVIIKLYEKEEEVSTQNQEDATAELKSNNDANLKNLLKEVNFVNELEVNIKKEIEADLELLKEAVEKIGIVRTFEVVEKVLGKFLENEDFFKHFLNETINRI